MGRILVFVGVICWFAMRARAEVDQAVLIPGGVSGYYHNVRAPLQWAQTFTVGAAGQLAQIDLQVFKNPQAALGLTGRARHVVGGRFPAAGGRAAARQRDLVARRAAVEDLSERPAVRAGGP